MATFEELQAASDRVKGGRTVPSIADVLSSPPLVKQLADEKRFRDKRTAKIDESFAEARAATEQAELAQQKANSKLLNLAAFPSKLIGAVARAPVRATTAVSLDFAGGLLELITGKKVDKKFTPTTALEKFIFGQGDIKSAQTFIDIGLQKSQQAAQIPGSVIPPDVAKGVGLGAVPFVAAGSIVLDLTPFGGGKKVIGKEIAKVAPKIAKIKNTDDILKLLKGVFKGSDEAFTQLSKNLADLDDAVQIQRVLGGNKKGVISIPTKAPIAPVGQSVANIEDSLDQARKFVQGVNTEKLTPEVKQVVDDLVRQAPEVLEPRRIISNSESIANAGKIEERPILKELLNAPEGQLTVEALNLRKEVSDGILKTKFEIDSIQQATALLKTRGKVASELGRALQSQKITDEALDSIQRFAKESLKRAKESGDPNLIKEIDDLLAEAFKGGKAGPTAFGRVYEYWINSILSSPLTHKANIIGNTATTIMKPVERIFELPFDVAASFFTGRRTVKAGQIPHEIMGMMSGVTEGVRKGLTASLSQEKALSKFAAISKIEDRVKNIPGLAGEVIRIPTKLLEAEDVFFKLVNGTGELYGLAYKEAKKSGLKGNDFYKKVAALIDNPTNKMLEEVGQEQLYRTFQNDLGDWGKKFMQLRKIPKDGSTFAKAAAGLTRFVVPFVRTPVNITKFALERSPAGFLKLIGAKGQADVTKILSRATMGSAISAAVATFVMQGRITGSGPKNKTEREALFRQGWAPYSVMIGNKYHSYQRLEPFSMIVGFTADAVERAKEEDGEVNENIAAQIVYSISQNLSDKTFFSGISGMFDAISDPERFADKWVTRQAVGFVPNVLSFFSRGIDRSIKNTKADSIPEMIWQQIQAKIPELSENVLPKRNVFGEDIKREGNLLTDLLLPQFSTIKNSQLESELENLDVKISFPSTSSKGVKFNQKEYDSLILNTGKRIKTDLDRLIKTPLYAKASPTAKQKIINDIVKIHKDSVRDQVFMFAQMRQLGFGDPHPAKNAQLIQIMAFPGWGSLDDDQRKNAINKVIFSR